MLLKLTLMRVFSKLETEYVLYYSSTFIQTEYIKTKINKSNSEKDRERGRRFGELSIKMTQNSIIHPFAIHLHITHIISTVLSFTSSCHRDKRAHVSTQPALLKHSVPIHQNCDVNYVHPPLYSSHRCVN